MGFLVKGDEGVFGCTREVGVAEDGEEDCGGEWYAVVGRSAGEEARDAAADGGVGIYIICLVASFDVTRYTTAISGGGTSRSSESIGADTTAGIGYKIIRPTIGTGDGLFARGKIRDSSVGLLFWKHNERDWYDHSGGNEEKKYNTEKGERPDRHTAASTSIRFRIVLCWRIGRKCLVSAKSRFG